MGLRHVIIVDGELFVKGIITRADLDQYRLEQFWQNEGEHMEKEMNDEELPPPVAYRTRMTAAGGPAIFLGRRRASSVQSIASVDTVKAVFDMEIARNVLEPSDSSNTDIRKRTSSNEVQ
jgi:hypothetical protein